MHKTAGDSCFNTSSNAAVCGSMSVTSLIGYSANCLEVQMLVHKKNLTFPT